MIKVIIKIYIIKNISYINRFFCQIIPYQSTLKLINVSNLQAMFQKAQVASSIGI